MTKTVEEVAARRDEMLQEAQSLEVQASQCLAEMTYSELEAACEMLKGIRRLNKEVDETFDDLISGQKEQLKKVQDRKGKYADPLTAAENVIKSKLTDYYEREYYAQSQEYADKLTAATDTAEKQRIAEIEQLRAAGMLDQAENLAGAPLAIVPIPRPAPTKMKGISVKTTWKAEVFDEDAIIAFALEHEEWRHLLGLKMPELNTLARMQKDAMAIPGVRAVSKRSISIRLDPEPDE